MLPRLPLLLVEQSAWELQPCKPGEIPTYGIPRIPTSYRFTVNYRVTTSNIAVAGILTIMGS